LKEGWLFVPTMLVLFYGIFIWRRIPESAVIASVIAIILAQIKKKTRFNKEKVIKLMKDIGINNMELTAVMLGVGFILGSFSMTGIGISFPRELFQLAGGNMVLLVFLTAVASLIMGMGMTTIACSHLSIPSSSRPALSTPASTSCASTCSTLLGDALPTVTPPVAIATIRKPCWQRHRPPETVIRL
jgi:TRAP-type uncharacterized transport system fused permease subunit